MRRMTVSSVVFFLAVLVLSGCGAKSGRQAVSGSVSRGGQPLKSGIISFFAVEGPPGPLGGALIANGEFKLPAEQGLDPGSYKVSISAPEPGGILTPEEKAAGASPKAKETLPARYNSATELKAEVKVGEPNQFTFTLE